jgi:glycosyltransferase involved in cell wall biosynthesis
MRATSARIPVTVVIPTYRAKNTLIAAIESVSCQTVQAYEVIVVDDASNDGTAEFVRVMQTKYPVGWLKLIELPKNMGAGEARNAGWDIAQGTCIAFLDADDCWHPRKLELQWKQFELNAELALCGHSFRFPWDPETDLTGPEAFHARLIKRREVLWRNPFVTPSVMLRRDVPLRFCARKRHMEDHLLWMEFVLSGHLCTKLSAPLATIGKHQFGSSGLSADLWAMEKGDLENYWRLFKLGHISVIAAVLLSVYSLLRYVRRLALVGMRRLYPTRAH